MVNAINTWTQKIVIVVIICTVIEMLLPEGKNKKYIKSIMGIYVVFTIISPIISKLHNNSLDLNDYLNFQNQENTSVQTIAPLDTNAYIEEVYKEKIKTNIEENILSMNYKVKKIDLTIETKEQKTYGTILFLKLKLEKTEDTTNKIKIQDIDISKESNETIDISEEEKLSIKKFLSNTYSIDEERIEVD